MAGSIPKTSSPFSWAAFQSRIRYLGTEEQKRIREAFELGVQVHAGQTRRSGEPYFTHPIAVAHILADMGADSDTIIVSLLHDVLEDTSLSEDEIEEQFGPSVRRMIDALTKLKAEDFSGRPTLNEQVETLRKLFTFMQEDVRIMVIKLVDRLHNMQTAEFLPEEKRQALAKETMDVYAKIADRLSMSDVRDELADLCYGILDPTLLEKMLKLRSEAEKRAQRVIGEMKKALKMAGSILPIDPHYEPHGTRKLLAKIAVEESTVTGISAFTVAFVCEDIMTCYQTLGALHQLWKRESLSFEDFINAPMLNGYKGLHTTVILEDGTRVRCKIRTQEMQEYARKGIAMLCFNHQPVGLPSYLDWSRRISPLSAGTADQSIDFWESLQSDILGESIMVYGRGDQGTLLPEGVTALDGVFYLYGEQAFRLKEILVNGKNVPFRTPLTHASTIEIIPIRKRTVSREWLPWVHTGLAVARIREGLSHQSREMKVEEGKRILEDRMMEEKRGLLAEFNEKNLRTSIQKLGFDSLEEGYIALAEGRMDVSSVSAVLFPKQKRDAGGATTQESRYIIRFRIPKDDAHILRRLAEAYEQFSAELGAMRIWSLPLSVFRHFSIAAHLTEERLSQLRRAVQEAGALDVSINRRFSSWKQGLALISIVLLWGLDPVAAHMILGGSVNPFDLTVVRFLVFAISAAILFTVHSASVHGTLKPLSPFHPTLLLVAGTLFVTGVTTYHALTMVSPLQYILLVIAGGVTLSALLRAVEQGGEWKPPTVVFIFCLTVAGFLAWMGRNSILGLLLALLSGIGFGLYTEVSRRFQEVEAHVKARYPAYLLWLSLFALGFSLPLLPFTAIGTLPTGEIVRMVVFSFVFVFLPYGLYYILLRNMEPVVLDRHILFVCGVTMIAEILFTQSLVPLFALPVLGVLAWWDYIARHSAHG